MSIGAFIWAKTWTTELTSSQKLVLLMIADRYNDPQKRAWPSVATLAVDCSLSTRQVKRCTKVLEQMGLIEIEPWFNASRNERTSNRYYLPMHDSESVKRSQVIRFDEEWDPEGLLIRHEMPA